MAGEKPDVLLIGQKKPVMVKGLEPRVTLHYLADAKDQDAFLKSIADKVRAVAIAYTANKIDAAFMQKLPKLETDFELRRRLRPHRRQLRRRARYRRHQYA